MQVISFMNMKGGVGKTTLAVNIAYGLAALHRQKVLIIDADPQFNASQYLLEDDAYLAHFGDDSKGSLLDIFRPRRPGPVRTTQGVARQVNRQKMALAQCSVNIYSNRYTGGKLDLIPASLNLIEMEMTARGTERRLRSYLQEKAGGYDYVLIDCPPTISIFTQAAILASSKYLVPIKPDPLSVVGLPLLERWLEDFMQDSGITLKSVGLVFTMVRGPVPQRMDSIISELRQTRGNEVFPDQLSVSTYVATSVEHHEPIFRYKKQSKPGKEMRRIIAEFYRRTSGVP